MSQIQGCFYKFLFLPRIGELISHFDIFKLSYINFLILCFLLATESHVGSAIVPPGFDCNMLSGKRRLNELLWKLQAKKIIFHIRTKKAKCLETQNFKGVWGE